MSTKTPAERLRELALELVTKLNDLACDVFDAIDDDQPDSQFQAGMADGYVLSRDIVQRKLLDLSTALESEQPTEPPPVEGWEESECENGPVIVLREDGKVVDAVDLAYMNRVPVMACCGHTPIEVVRRWLYLYDRWKARQEEKVLTELEKRADWEAGMARYQAYRERQGVERASSGMSARPCNGSLNGLVMASIHDNHFTWSPEEALAFAGDLKRAATTALEWRAMEDD